MKTVADNLVPDMLNHPDTCNSLANKGIFFIVVFPHSYSMTGQLRTLGIFREKNSEDFPCIHSNYYLCVRDCCEESLVFCVILGTESFFG